MEIVLSRIADTVSGFVYEIYTDNDGHLRNRTVKINYTITVSNHTHYDHTNATFRVCGAGQSVPIDEAVEHLRTKFALTVEDKVDDAPEKKDTVIDAVIKQLDQRVVPSGDRARLRDAVDRADAPQRGRAGADERLGRAIRWSPGRTVYK